MRPQRRLNLNKHAFGFFFFPVRAETKHLLMIYTAAGSILSDRPACLGFTQRISDPLGIAVRTIAVSWRLSVDAVRINRQQQSVDGNCALGLIRMQRCFQFISS